MTNMKVTIGFRGKQVTTQCRPRGSPRAISRIKSRERSGPSSLVVWIVAQGELRLVDCGAAQCVPPQAGPVKPIDARGPRARIFSCRVDVETGPRAQPPRKRLPTHAEQVAVIMDRLAPIPGTRSPIGLDGMFGITPGFPARSSQARPAISVSTRSLTRYRFGDVDDFGPRANARNPRVSRRHFGL